MSYEATFIIDRLIATSEIAATRLEQVVSARPDLEEHFRNAAQEHYDHVNSLKVAVIAHGPGPIAQVSAPDYRVLAEKTLTVAALGEHVVTVFSDALNKDLPSAVSDLVELQLERIISIYATLNSLPGKTTIKIPPRGK